MISLRFTHLNYIYKTTDAPKIVHRFLFIAVKTALQKMTMTKTKTTAHLSSSHRSEFPRILSSSVAILSVTEGYCDALLVVSLYSPFTLRNSWGEVE